MVTNGFNTHIGKFLLNSFSNSRSRETKLTTKLLANLVDFPFVTFVKNKTLIFFETGDNAHVMKEFDFF